MMVLDPDFVITPLQIPYPLANSDCHCLPGGLSTILTGNNVKEAQSIIEPCAFFISFRHYSIKKD